MMLTYFFNTLGTEKYLFFVSSYSEWVVVFSRGYEVDLLHCKV